MQRSGYTTAHGLLSLEIFLNKNRRSSRGGKEIVVFLSLRKNDLLPAFNFGMHFSLPDIRNSAGSYVRT